MTRYPFVGYIAKDVKLGLGRDGVSFEPTRSMINGSDAISITIRRLREGSDEVKGHEVTGTFGNGHRSGRWSVHTFTAHTAELHSISASDQLPLCVCASLSLCPSVYLSTNCPHRPTARSFMSDWVCTHKSTNRTIKILYKDISKKLGHGRAQPHQYLTRPGR